MSNTAPAAALKTLAAAATMPAGTPAIANPAPPAAKVIPPTIGRIVWYWPSAEYRSGEGAQAQPAQVCYVHNDRCVNLAGFNCNGIPFAQTSVPLVQPGDPIPPKGSFCEWMPYQLQAAAK